MPPALIDTFRGLGGKPNLFLLFHAPTALSQTTSWDTLKSDNGEFSAQLPAGCYSHFYNKDGFAVSQNENGYQLTEMRLIQCFYDQN